MFVNKLIVIIFCTCILTFYASYICYYCIEPIINGWFIGIAVLSFIMILCNLVINEYKKKANRIIVSSVEIVNDTFV